jgi:hypothetical protein
MASSDGAWQRPTEHDADGDQDDGLASVLAARLTPGQRLRRLSLIAGMLLLVALVVLGGTSGLWDGLRAWLPGSAALSNGADRLYLDLDVPWTSVTLDGHTVRPPLLGVQPPLRLASGHHVIAWHADPFAAKSCKLSVPPAPGDTCDGQLTGAVSANGQPAAQVLHLGASILDIASDQRAPLIQAIQAALDARSGATTVAVGERYVASGDRVASRPIQATLSYQAQVGLSGLACAQQGQSSAALACIVSVGNCAHLCTVPAQVRGAAGSLMSQRDSWYVFAVYHPSWSYATGDRSVDLRDQPIEVGGQGVDQQLALLRIRWDTSARRWTATARFDDAPELPLDIDGQLIGANPACVALRDLFFGAEPQQEASVYTQVRFIAAPNPADGCLVIASPRDAPASPMPARLSVMLLYRFGVVLAASDLARQYRPDLPVATPAEFQLALQLVSQLGGWTE